jgi:hypothetical protein
MLQENEPIGVDGALEVPEVFLKLSVNVQESIGNRLRRIAFQERLSESSIVEVALRELFVEKSNAEIAAYLRSRGATLRRKGG